MCNEYYTNFLIKVRCVSVCERVCVRSVVCNKITLNFVMHIKSLIFVIVSAIVIAGTDYAFACTETGRNCRYSYECCSGACSAAFGFCLHR
nr:ctl [Calliteara abietis nucleopolyhedrovirus]